MDVSNIITTPVILSAIPVFFLFIFAEIIAVRYFNQRGSLHAKDDSVSIFMGLFSVLTNGAAAFLTLGMLVWAQQFQIYALPLTWTTLIACFVLDDLRYYLHPPYRASMPLAMGHAYNPSFQPAYFFRGRIAAGVDQTFHRHDGFKGAAGAHRL